jgi:DNA-3-methyladenine glycosylase I
LTAKLKPAKKTEKKRCGWLRLGNPRYLKYHDQQWGVPLHHERKLFEMLVLEGQQAGLSWETILNKRENFRKAFDGFDPERVARFGEKRVRKLLRDAGIIRNRMKIRAAIANARAFREVQREHGRFDRYIWNFTGGKPVQNRWTTLQQVPPKTAISDAMSKDLKQRGFRFVGSTICYAFMQAVGMVNDHTTDCFRHREIRSAARGTRAAAGFPRRTVRRRRSP